MMNEYTWLHIYDYGLWNCKVLHARTISDCAVLCSTASAADQYKYTTNEVIQVSRKGKKKTDSNNIQMETLCSVLVLW